MNPVKEYSPRQFRQQQGISLIVVLILLSAIFIVAAFGARLTILGEKASRNDRDRQIAFQAAEAALADAEIDIMGPNEATNSRVCKMDGSQIDLFIDGCGSTDADRGLCATNSSTTTQIYKTIDFEETGSSRHYVTLGDYTGRSVGFSTDSSALPAKNPRYIIELIPYNHVAGANASQRKSAFLVTSVGYGLNEKTQVMLQSVIFKPEQTPGC